MTEALFQARKYAQAHPDVAKHVGADNDKGLAEHYEKHGRRELRGIPLNDYAVVERLVLSDEGDVYVQGWVDRRICPELRFEVEAGYLRYPLDAAGIAWLRRPDVDEVTGDSRQESGFILLTRVEGLTQHADVAVLLNGRKMLQQPAMRWKSLPNFLTETLTLAAPLLERPSSGGTARVDAMGEAFRGLWARYLASLTFLPAMAHEAATQPAFSIVITLHRDFGMLLQQLSELSPFLEKGRGEVIVIGNAIAERDLLISRLRGFCQIHPISLRLYFGTGNSGFAAAANFGASAAKAPALIFMAPAIFPSGDPAATADFLAAPPDATLTGARLHYSDGALMHDGMLVIRDDIIDCQTSTLLPVLRIEPALNGALPGPAGQFMTAALWKIGRDDFLAAGGFPVDYIFASYEDADFSLGLLDRGGSIALHQDSRWLHLEPASRQPIPYLRAAQWLNRALFSTRFAASPHVHPAGLV